MAVTILVPGALRGEIDGRSQVDVDAHGTLAEILGELDARWPRLARRIHDERGEIRRYVNVYVDGEDVRRLDGLATPVGVNAEVQILPSVAGG